jgi:general secretion pathway protein I
MVTLSGWTMKSDNVKGSGLGKSRQCGFTLIEVMIALFILAAVSGALLRNASLSISQTNILQQRTLAYWIAENQLNEIRSAERIEDNFPGIGSERISVTMADRDWEVVIDVEATENKEMRRIIVSVFNPNDMQNNVIELVGFRGLY